MKEWFGEASGSEVLKMSSVQLPRRAELFLLKGTTQDPDWFRMFHLRNKLTELRYESNGTFFKAD